MEPLGFVVSCTPSESRATTYDCKVYAVVMMKNGKVRFRIYSKFGEFPTYEHAKQIATEYAKDRGWPYCAYLKHNSIAPSLIYKWYFKDPPIKPI